MTKAELIAALNECDDDIIIVIREGGGAWAHIDTVKKIGPYLEILMQRYPIFDDRQFNPIGESDGLKSIRY